jgi:hypothetical protein
LTVERGNVSKGHFPTMQNASGHHFETCKIGNILLRCAAPIINCLMAAWALQSANLNMQEKFAVGRIGVTVKRLS